MLLKQWKKNPQDLSHLNFGTSALITLKIFILHIYCGVYT